jgi:hypothetical protein
VVRGGIYVVGDDRAVAPGGRLHDLPEPRPLGRGDLQPLGPIAASIARASGDVAVAIDADVPGSLVHVALASAVAGGASRVRLLFEMKNATPVPTPPAGIDPEAGGLDVVAPAFARAMLRCPDAGKAFTGPLDRGDAAGAVRALASALPGCPCDIDMDVIEFAAALVAGGVPLTAVPVHLTADSSAGSDVELPLEAPWSEIAGSLVAAGRNAPVHLALPPAPPPPPPPPLPRKRRH